MEVFQETAVCITDSRWCIRLELQSVLLDSHLRIFCNEHDHVCCSVSDQAEESPPEETLASFPLSKSLSGSHDEDALFKERLRNMGKSIYFDTRKRIIDYIMSSHQMLQLSGEHPCFIFGRSWFKSSRQICFVFLPIFIPMLG